MEGRGAMQGPSVPDLEFVRACVRQRAKWIAVHKLCLVVVWICNRYELRMWRLVAVRTAHYACIILRRILALIMSRDGWVGERQVRMVQHAEVGAVCGREVRQGGEMVKI